MEKAARELQQAYARAIRSASPPEDGGTPGGSLSNQVLRPDLVTHKRWGFVFSPSRLGRKFLWWWRGTRRQAPRGRGIEPEDRFFDELERDLARQIERFDRKSGGR